MTLKLPRDLVLEAYLGRWVDVTALAEGRALRQVEPVVVTWGLPSEQTRVLAPPSTVEGTLNNIGGHWTPGNAMSDYWQYLRTRNVPARLALRVVRDTFTGRTSSFAWLVADTETTAWQDSGVNYIPSVGGGVGTIAVSAVSSFGLLNLGDSYPDCQVRASCTVNINDVTGGSLEPLNLVLRYQPSGTFAGEHYLLRVEVTSAEILNVTIFHNSLGAISSTVAVPGVVNAVSAKDLRAAFQVEGQTLRGKVYKNGPPGDRDQFEPLGWQVAAHHERLSGGFPGIRCGIAGGNTNAKPVSFLVDDLEVRLLQHTGEVAKLQPNTDETHQHKTADFKIADITQRLGRKNRPALSSTVRRYVPTVAPLAYWPLDATVYTDALRPLVGGGLGSILASGSVGLIQMQALAPWLGNGVSVIPSDISIKLPVDGAPTTSWTVDLAFLMGVGTTGNTIAGPHAVTTDVSIWQVQVSMAAGTVSMWLNPSGGAQVLLGTSGVLPELTTGQVHYLRWTTVQNGGNVDWFVYLDGTLVLSGTRVAFTNTAVIQARLFGINQPVVYGQVALYGGTGPTLTDAAAVYRGFLGERALTRAIRLAAEEGVQFDYYGSAGDTRPMGPQRPIPLLDQFVECAEADGAFLFAPRYTAGVAMRPRRAMSARAADATLSYSSGHIAPKLAPQADDVPTANLVRASRPDGGFLIIDTPTGPMNTQDPGTDPDAAGRSPAEAPGNVESEAQLGDLGGWVRALGTTPDVRYPRVPVNLAARDLTTGADPTLPARQVVGLKVGDRLLIAGMQAADRYDDLDQLVLGGTATFKNAKDHQVALNTAPYEKYRAGTYGDTGSRYDGATTTLDAQLLVGVTGVVNVTTSAGQVWTTAAGAFPMDVWVGGERVTLSGITGAGAAQGMTISARAVNGAARTWPAGTPVALFLPVYYA